MANPQIASQGLLPDNGNTLELPSQSPRGDSMGADPNRRIIDAIIQTESSGRPHAMSNKGAIGLMQVMPHTAVGLGVSPPQLFDPTVNRQVGTRYFNMLLSRYGGDTEKALWAYNAGPARVDSGHVPDSARTYARKVLAAAGGMVGKLMGEGTANAEELPPGVQPMPELPPGVQPMPGGAAPTASPSPKPLPWWVKYGTDYAPMVGQWGGEAGAAVLAPEGGPLSIGAGSAVGTGIGEGVRYAGRKLAGAPTPSALEMGGDVAISGVISSAFNKILTPKMRGVVTEAQNAWQGAKAESENALKELEELLGKGRRTAAQEAEDMASGRALKQTVNSAEDKAFDALSQKYETILGPHYNQPTPQSLDRELDLQRRYLQGLRLDVPPDLLDKIQHSPPTVRSANEIARMAGKYERKISDTTVKEAMSRIRDAALNDQISALSAPEQKAFREVNQQWAETLTQFKNTKNVIQGASLPSAAQVFFKGEESQIAAHLDQIDKMPADLRDAQRAFLRDGWSSAVLRAVNRAEVSGPVEQIKVAVNLMKSTKPTVFERLFPGMDKERFLSTADDLIKKQSEVLENRNEASAVNEAIKKYVLSKNPHLLAYMQKHLGFSAVILGAGALGASQYGVEPREVGFVLTGLFGVSAWMAVSKSIAASKLFQQAVKSPGLARAATLAVRALDVAASEELKRGVGIGRGDDAQEKESQ